MGRGQEEDEEEAAAAAAAATATKSGFGGRHVKKRALRNKGLTISFNDKDLSEMTAVQVTAVLVLSVHQNLVMKVAWDFVTGFHKRKKKRRKQAQQELQEKERLRRIYERKKRKMEKELALYGGVMPSEDPSGAGLGPDASGSEEYEQDGTSGPTASVSGTKMYDNGDMTITVTTSELSHEDEDLKVPRSIPIPKLSDAAENKHSLPVKKKPFKKATKHWAHKKPKTSARQKGKKKGRNR